MQAGWMSVLSANRTNSAPMLVSGKQTKARNVNAANGLQIPQFLKWVPY